MRLLSDSRTSSRKVRQSFKRLVTVRLRSSKRLPRHATPSWSRLSRRHVRKALVSLVTLRPPSNRRSGLPSPTSVSKSPLSVWRSPRRCSVRI